MLVLIRSRAAPLAKYSAAAALHFVEDYHMLIISRRRLDRWLNAPPQERHHGFICARLQPPAAARHDILYLPHFSNDENSVGIFRQGKMIVMGRHSEAPIIYIEAIFRCALPECTLRLFRLSLMAGAALAAI